MSKLLAALLSSLLFLSPAYAGTGTITVKDAGGVTRTFDVITDGSGNFNSTAIICDQSAAATCASVGTAGSPSTNALTVQAVTLGHGTAANAMRVELPTDGTGVVGITAWGGSSLGAMANYGTSPGAVLVPGVNAFITNANANGQATMANSSPVAIASNQSVADPCMFQAKSNVAIGTSGATNVQAVAGSATKKVYICSLSLVSASAAVFNVIEGTGAACTTANEAAIIGSTTAADGMPFAANGGMTLGSGVSTVGVTATAANGVCILVSSSVQFGGNLTYVQQ